MDLSPFKEMTAEERLAKELKVPARQVCIVGSTLICGSGKDTDFLCLVPSEDSVTAAGFQPDIEVTYESELRSFRRGSQNIIATTNANFYFAEVAIAHAAKAIATDKFDMRDRDERVRFHSAVRSQVLSRFPDALEF